MKKSYIILLACGAAIVFTGAALTIADSDVASTTPGVIVLPKPDRKEGVPLMQAFNDRKSGRDFSDKEVSNETLSSLLWATDGINREDGRRTYPTARNIQDLELYVALGEKAYRYDPKAHALHPVELKGTLFPALGSQGFAKTAPVQLIYVYDAKKHSWTKDEAAIALTAGMHIGAAYQNAALYCASAGLSNVVRGMINHGQLAKVLDLADGKRVAIAQSIGWPK